MKSLWLYLKNQKLLGNDEDSHVVILEPFETASVPHNRMRGFGWVRDEGKLLLGTVASTDPGGVQLRDDVLFEASWRVHRRLNRSV